MSKATQARKPENWVKKDALAEKAAGGRRTVDAPARDRARNKAVAKRAAEDNWEKRDRFVTIDELWFDELQAAEVDTDENRGEAVAQAATMIRNVKSAQIVDYLRWILRTGLWRSYTYPNGDHFEFLEREFDYFCAQINIDPHLVNEAARSTGANDLLVELAEASLATSSWPAHDTEAETNLDMPRRGSYLPDRSKRRSVDEITRTYPTLGAWLERYGYSNALGGARLHLSKAVRSKVRKGATTGQARGRVEFRVESRDESRLPELIVDALVRKGLDADVYRLLRNAQRRQERANGTTRKGSK
jgi:hypothetical protein